MTSFKMLLEIEPSLNPVIVIIDFEKASMNAWRRTPFLQQQVVFFPLITDYLQTRTGTRVGYPLPIGQQFCNEYQNAY